LILLTTLAHFFNPHIYRKRTKKKAVKKGRPCKRSKTAGGDEPLLTPRTRGALAREAAAKAKTEALEAEMKAAAAREAAQAAAREELEATREEFAAREELEAAREEPALELMAIEAVPPETPIRRYSCHLKLVHLITAFNISC
jgi:hypothetical protein